MPSISGASISGDAIYVSLHTGFPGTTNEPLRNEVTYTGYRRVQTHRFQDWVVSGASVLNKGKISFAMVFGSKECVTHVAISAAGIVLESGSLFCKLQLQDNLVPQFESGTLIITDAWVSLIFRSDHTPSTSQVPLWKYEGRCLKCGELGRLDTAGGASCSTHGFYTLEIVPKP
jgi:hypothetical protein